MASTFRSTWAKHAGGGRTLWHDGVTNLDLPQRLHPGGTFFMAVLTQVTPTPAVSLITPIMGTGSQTYENQIQLGHPVALVKNIEASTFPCMITNQLGAELYKVPVGAAVYVLPVGYGPNLFEGDWVFVPLTETINVTGGLDAGLPRLSFAATGTVT